MSKPAVIGIVVFVIIVLAGGGILLAKNSSSNANKTDTSASMNMDTTSTNSTDSTSNDSNNLNPTATDAVTIENFAFNPANITVKKGTTVTWTNKDSSPHTVIETDGQTGPNSGDLATGKTFTFTYNTVGTFKYHCSIHSSMTGTVTVTE
jgi:plastocyanin